MENRGPVVGGLYCLGYFEGELVDKIYGYRPGANDTWEVFGTFTEDEENFEDWVGNLNTETLALTLVMVLNNRIELQIMQNLIKEKACNG